MVKWNTRDLVVREFADFSKKFVKLCLHSSYLVQNFFQFDDFFLDFFRREFADLLRKPVSVFKTGSCASGQRPTDETEEEANPEDANKMASNQVLTQLINVLIDKLISISSKGKFWQ